MSDFKAKITAELDTSRVEQQIKELDGKKVKFGVDNGNAKKEIEKVDNSIKSATQSTKTFGDTLKTSAKLGAAYSITSKAFQTIREAANEAKKAIEDFDSSIMDLRMATGGTYSEVSNLVKGYNGLGKELGATTKEVSSGADSWLRQGHSIADTNTLIKDSMILSKIANLESAKSTQYLTSAMKGYKVEVGNVIGICDKLMAVDLSAAVDAGELAEAMSRTAASADIAGISMDKLLGYLAATGEVTQKSMTSIGESFKTIFTKMGDIKSGKLQFIDEDGTTESLSDVETILTNLGVKLRDSDNEFRNFGDVLDEVGAAWDSYSTVQKAAVSKAFAGTRQSENFKVLMENYSKATSYMETSMNSAGTSEQKFEAYLDSLEAKTKSLQASFESLAVNSFSTEIFGGIIDATTSLVEFMDETNALKGSLIGLATAGAVKGFTVLTTGITNATVKLNNFNAALNIVKSGNIGASEIQRLALMTNGLSASQLKAVISSTALTTQQRIAILTAQGMTNAEAKAALASMGLATAEGVATTSTMTLSAAMKGLWATLKANPLFLVITAVTVAISAYSLYQQKVEDTREKLEELKQESQEITTELTSLNDELKTTAERIAELEGKESLTFTEKEELDNLKAQNAELQRQIDLLNLQKKINNKEKNKIFVETMDKNLNDSEEYHSEYGTYTDQSGETRHRVNRGSGGQYSYGSATEKDYINQQLSDYKNNLKEIAKIEKDYLSGKINEKTYEKKVQALKEHNEEIEQYLGDKNTEIQTDAEGIEYISNPTSEDDKKVNAWLDYINDFQDRMAIALGGENAKENAFDRLVTTTFAEETRDLQTLGEQGDVTAEQLKSEKYSEFIDKLVEIGFISDETDGNLETVALAFNKVSDSAEEAAEDVETATDSMSDFTSRMSGIQGLQAGLDQLDKIYTDIADGKDFDYSAVLNNKDFTDAFGGLGESYDKFMETILNSPKDLSACQSAFDNLVSSYINNSKALDDLTESERNATVAALEQMGVSNAAIIVDEKIAIVKEKKRLETELGTDATFDEVMAMRDEEGQSYATIQALVSLATAKLDVNKSAIDLTSDINQIIALAEKAGASTASLKELARAKILFNEAEQLEWAASVYTDENGNPLVDSKTGKVLDLYTDAKNAATKAYQDAVDIMNTPIEYTLPEYKGGSTYRDSVDKASKEAEKNKPEKYDWITTSIERTEREIQNAQKVADSAYKSLDIKLAETDKQIKGITKEIEIQSKALKKYKKEADSVKLSEDIKAKVRDGSISIDKYDDKTKELIDEYSEWYNKSLDCADAIAELDEELTSLYDKKFDDISTDYENQLSQIEHLTNTYENNLADLEARGYLGGQEYYAALQDTERQKIALLEKQLADLTEAMNTAIDEGMEVNSPKWYDMQESINSVKEEIQASNTALIEYQNSIDELDWEAFDFMQERISAVADEAQFLIKLLDDSDLINDKGRITGKGFAVAGLHVVSYNTYMKQSEEYAKKILEINAKLAKDPSNTELIKQREELLQLQRESILAAKDEKDAIIDMIEESINKKIDAMKELIDTYKDSLRSAKDLYDYQKRIKDQTSNITSLQKQLAAYENDDSEETRAKVQQIRVDLEKAKDELEETEYDKFISDTEKMLDNFYEDYEDTLNARMDNIEMLLSTIIDTISFGVNGISSIIQLVAGIFGYTVSDGMTSILGGSGNVIGEYGMPSFDFSSISSTIDGFVSVLSGAISTGIEIASGIIGYFTPKKAYKTGGLVDYTGVAQLDGTPSKPELVLNSRDTENFIQLKDALRQMAENDVQLLPSSNYINGLSSVVPHGILDMSSHISKYREPQENSYSVSVGDINTTIEIDHVMDYDDFVSQAKNDPQFERFIGSLTLDRLVGGSNLAKYKYWK